MKLLAERAQYHHEKSQTAFELSSDHGMPGSALTRIEAAIHDLGETIILAVAGSSDQSADIEALTEALRQLDEAVDRHQAAVEKAESGLSPWGEILNAGVELKNAIGRLRAR